MFDRDSRYLKTPVFKGADFSGTRPRIIQPTSGVIEHRVTKEDRLDRLAAHYYNDSRKWWLILDANPEIFFGGNLDMGRYANSVIVIPADNSRSRYG